MALKKDGDKRAVHVELSEKDYEILKERAKLEERSTTSLARLILRRYVDSYEGDF